jgi:eukaryotic-like serine/threonine-protein kinase
MAVRDPDQVAMLDTAPVQELEPPTEVWATGVASARSPAPAPPIAARPPQSRALPPPQTWRDQTWSRAALPDTGLGLFGLRELPPVGRDRERDQLWATLTAMAQGRSSVVVVRGDSGSGKSHLARWFREAAQECGAALGVGARHYRETDGQCGLSEMLRRRMRLHGLSPQESWDRIRQHLRHASGPGPLWLRCAQLIAPRIDLRAAPFSTERERHLILAECLDHLARGHGWIAQLDGAHWAPECFAFAQTMLGRREACVVILTVPPTVDASVQRALDTVLEKGAKLIELGPLSDEEMTNLVANTLPLAQELRLRIVATASGNPLIATQTLANWIRAGRITSGTAGHRMVRTANQPTARSAGQSAQWTPDQQLAVAALAALGPSVDRSEWHQVCLELGVEVGGALETQLLEWGVLVPTYGGWRVAHASQLDELRSLTDPLGLEARCHAACARVLLTDTPEEKLRVARHHLEAGERAIALRLMCLAAQTLFDLGQETSAYRILHTRRACLEGPEADADAAMLEMKCAVATGDLATAWQWLDRARQLAPQNLVLAIGEVNLLNKEKKHARAAEVARTVVGRAQAVGDDAVEAIARAGLGTALARQGRFREARHALDQAVDFCRMHGADRALNLALSSRVVVAMNLGDNDAQCDADMEEGIAVAARLGNLRNIGAKLILAGERQRKRGNLGRALSLYLDAHERLQRVDPAAAAIAATNLVLTCLAQGDVQAATHWLASAEPALDNEVFQDLLDIQRFAIHLMKGEPAKAYWHAQEKLRQDWDLAWILEVAGRAALEGPNDELARLALQRASQIWRSQGDIERANELHRLLGVLDSGTLPMDLAAVHELMTEEEDPA